MSISIYLSELLGYTLASFIAPTLWIALCFKSTWKGGAWGLFHGTVVMWLASAEVEIVAANTIAGVILGFASARWKKKEILESTEQKDNPNDSVPVKPNAVLSWPTVLTLTIMSVVIVVTCFYFYGFERTGQHQAGKTGLEGWSESERRNMARNADRMAQQLLRDHKDGGPYVHSQFSGWMKEKGYIASETVSTSPTATAQAAEQQRNTIEPPAPQQKNNSSDFKSKLDFYWDMVRNLLN